jgi:predicted  nucleic acid-binding Zn-ribbon protein
MNQPTTIEPALLALLHGKLRLFYDLTDQATRAPKQVDFARQREQQYRQKLESTTQQLQDMRRKAKEKQNELGTREAQVKKMQVQQDGAANNREYSMLGENIKATVAANEVLGVELFELLEQVDAMVQQEKSAADVLAKAVIETQTTTNQTADTIKRLERDLATVEGELQELFVKIPGDLRAEMQRKRPALREKTVTPVDDGACSSCWQVITPQMRTALTMKQAILCPGCGALLYMPLD